MHDDYDPLDMERLLAVSKELLYQLPEPERLRALDAEPGSQRLYPLGDGWWRTTVGLSDPVELGCFHIAALRNDNEPGSVN